MMLAVLNAALLSLTQPAFAGSFGGYDERNDPGTRWERFDLVITNNTEAERSIGLCPRDADMILKTHQRSTRSAFAVKVDDEDWSFSCAEKLVAPGENVTFGMFFRPAFATGPSRTIEVDTNVGRFLLNP